MLNNVEESIFRFKRQISINLRSVLALINLGRIYKLMGNKNVGNKYLRQALKADPKAKAAKIYLKQIK